MSALPKKIIYREDVYLLKGGKVNTVASVSDEDVLQSNTIVISVLLVHYMSNV